MKTATKRGLYFTAGVVPTDKERAAAAALAITAFRNSEHATHLREHCNVVAGAVPSAYLNVEGIEVVKPGPTAEELAAEEAAKAAKIDAETKAQAEADALTNAPKQHKHR